MKKLRIKIKKDKLGEGEIIWYSGGRKVDYKEFVRVLLENILDDLGKTFYEPEFDSAVYNVYFNVFGIYGRGYEKK